MCFVPLPCAHHALHVPTQQGAVQRCSAQGTVPGSALHHSYLRQPRHHSTSHSHRHCSAMGPTGPATQDTQRTPGQIPIIVLARKSHHSGPGPKLHQNITNLIPLRTVPASGGAPVLPQAQNIHHCGAQTPAALHQSDALLLGKAPKIHSATCYGTPPTVDMMHLTDHRSQVLAKLRALITPATLPA